MITYIYFVKCPNCEDEHFDFFDEAKEFALGCLSQKPIITQTEVCRNDFGECTDSADLGTVWSWEDIMGEGGYTDAEPTKSIFTKDDLKLMADGKDPEFDAIDNSVDFEIDEVSDDPRKSITEDSDWNPKTPGYYGERIFNLLDKMSGDDIGRCFAEYGWFDILKVDELTDTSTIYDRVTDFLDTDSGAGLYSDLDKYCYYNDITESCSRKPIPEGMTIEQLVEEMEENEDTVECTWCEELFDKSECRKEVNLGWLCSRCEAAIKSRGETLTFKENNYWDFLDEDITAERSIEELVRDSINHLVNDLGQDSNAEDFVDDVILDIERNYDNFVPEDPMNHSKWASAIASEVSRQLNNPIEEDLETKTWICAFEGNEIGTVEAATEEEASEKMQRKYPEYPYGLYDGCFEVYPADEDDLTEATELHDLGNEYDDGYPTETPEVSDSHLKLCPECGKETFDIETGICVECGFN